MIPQKSGENLKEKWQEEKKKVNVWLIYRRKQRGMKRISRENMEEI